MSLIVMGVSGAGKSTLGALLAERLGWGFHDADGFHPAANLAKMRAGVPLDDADRMPWLAAINAFLVHEQAAGRDVVVACSALKARYREQLSRGLHGLRFVYLRGDRETIGERLASRHGHFMPATLLDSQFDALEEPDDAIVVDVSATPACIVETVLRALG